MALPILIVAAITMVFVLGFYFDRKRRIEFRKTFPPLTDDEFVQRCGPGTDPEVALKVRGIIATQLGIPPEEIYPDHRFIEDLKAD